MRVLIATNQFYHFAGGEMVALELAEHLVGLGHEVHLAANEIGAEMRGLLTEAGIRAVEDPAEADPLSFDLVWSQHHLLPLLLAGRGDAPLPEAWPFMVFAHLSPYDPGETPGPFLERELADLILANSPETAQALAAFGAPFDAAEVFANPAPAAFAATDPPGARLTSLLVVSNHRNRALGQALSRVAGAGVRVTRVGRRHEAQRVTPDLIAAHDAVLTIGKTTQYALRAARPVFCYDRFGGPGWITSETVDRAAWFNFSGRDSGVERAPEALAHEILSGYAAARDAATGWTDEALAPFRLEDSVAAILGRARAARADEARNRARAALWRAPRTVQRLHHEARLCALLRKEFTQRRALERKSQRIKALFRPVRRLFR